MKNQRRKNNIIIGSLLAVLLVMGIGYAAFSSKLNINGTGSVSGNWDVKITNITSKEVVGTAGNKTEPTYTDTTATFYTTLQSPGDSMTYDIEVSNVGNVDAVLKKITVNTGSNDAITFETSGLKEGDSLLKQEKKLLTIKVSFNDSVTKQPENVSATIKVSLEYEQKNIGSGAGDSGTTGSSATIAKLKQNTLSASSCTLPNSTDEDSSSQLNVCGSGLYKDTVTSGRYYYRGSNPNNYIKFNGEMWRIISVESNGSLKIIRNEQLSDGLKWDAAGNRSSEASTYCINASDYGCNAWAATSNLVGSPSTFIQYSPNGNISDSTKYTGTVTNDSTMLAYLNGTYYNSLSSAAKEKVVKGTFNVSTPGPEYDTESLETDAVQEAQYQWNGYVALYTITELSRASLRTQCNSLSAHYYWNIDVYDLCNNNNWLWPMLTKSDDSYEYDYEWTLSPYVDSSRNDVWIVRRAMAYDAGSAGSSITNTANGKVRPVLHLSSNITLSGTGTSTNPYVITN